MDWQMFCRAPSTQIAPIRIELRNGLTVEGRIKVEDAKTIFRQPKDLAPIEGDAMAGEVVLVLPKSAVKRIAFPHWPGPQAN